MSPSLRVKELKRSNLLVYASHYLQVICQQTFRGKALVAKMRLGERAEMDKGHLKEHRKD